MDTFEVRTKIINLITKDRLSLPKYQQSLTHHLSNCKSYTYKKGIYKHILPNLHQKNPTFDKQILQDLQSAYMADPFLWLLNCLVSKKQKDYKTASQLFHEFLQNNSIFFINSYVVVILSKCYIKSRAFLDLLKNIQVSQLDSEINDEHKITLLCHRAYSFETIGQPEKARLSYQSIIGQNCSVSQSCRYWLEIQNNPSLSLVESIENYLSSYKKSSQVYKDLKFFQALIYFKLGKIEQSLVILSGLIYHNKNIFICSSLMGKCWFVLKNYRKSFSAYLMALESQRNSPEAWFNLAKVYNECDSTKALKALEKAQNADQGDFKVITDLNEDLKEVFINFARFCEVREADFSNKVGHKRGRKEKIKCKGFQFVDDEGEITDADLLCSLKKAR